MPGSQTPKEEGLNQPPTREGRPERPRRRRKGRSTIKIMVLAKRPRQITVYDQNVY